LRLLTLAATVAGASALWSLEEGDEDCFGGDFTRHGCCSARWGLTGNPVCWDDEFTYLKCCGLGDFPRRPEDDLAWDEELRLNPAEIGETFDFIVVGAGSAGSVVASRLASKDGPDGLPYRVLLLEEGPGKAPAKEKGGAAHPDNPPDGGVWRPKLNVTWTLDDEERTWSYSTGQGAGGTGAANSMIYMRGSPSEYEAYGWSEEEVLDAFKALEAPMEAPGFVADSKYYREYNAEEDDAPGYHLSLVSATKEELPPFFRDLLKAFERGGVPHRIDPHSGPSMHGVGGVWRAMGCGHARCQPTRVPRMGMAIGRPRSSTAAAFLVPTMAKKRQRLKVLVEASVERLVFDDAKRCIGVEISLKNDGAKRDGKRRRIFYRSEKEVILSAGTFYTPKILMVSGIGERTELLRLGIPPVVHSPEVGRNLHDHVGMSIVVGTNVQCPEGYHENGKGGHTILGNTDQFIGQLYAFLNSSSDELGAKGPLDAEIMMLEGCFAGHLSIVFTVMLLQGHTRGRIVVQSRNPSTQPHVDYKPLSDARDINLLANVTARLFRSVLNSEKLAKYELNSTPGWEIISNFKRLAQWIRESLWFYSHPGGTAKVQRPNIDSNGVVDSDFRVIGTQGLRVADASVLTVSPTGHTDGPARLLGELAARAILREHSDKEASADDAQSLALSGYPGVKIPRIGFGTNGFEDDRAVKAVSKFLQNGGRMLDTAVLYNNHRSVAQGIAASGIARSGIFVVTKIPPGDMGYTEATRAIERSLSELGGQIDLLLIHWPSNFDPNAPLPRCASGSEGSWTRCRLETWRAMEEFCNAGKVRSLGVSNFAKHHLIELLEAPERKLKVAVNEIEFHPYWPQPDVMGLCRQHNIKVIAYGSTGGSLMGGAMLRVPAITTIAKRRQKSPAQVLFKWAVQQDVIIIPSSSSEAHMAENMDVLSWELTKEDMQALNAIGKTDRMRVYMPDPNEAP